MNATCTVNGRNLLCTWPVALILLWTSEKWNLFLKKTWVNKMSEKSSNWQLYVIVSLCLGARIYEKGGFSDARRTKVRTQLSPAQKARTDVGVRIADIIKSWYWLACTRKTSLFSCKPANVTKYGLGWKQRWVNKKTFIYRLYKYWL